MNIDYIRALKEEKHMTSQQLADISKVPISTVNRILSGQTDNPGLQAVCDMVYALGGSVDEMMGRPAEKQDAAVKLYERSIAVKNKWLLRLFVVCCILVFGILASIIIDILVPTIGYVRY